MSTRELVLEALRAAAEDGVSGEALAARLGVSRVAVGKHVAALRDAGYVIEASPHSGYHLISIPDLPLPAEVAEQLQSDFWLALHGGAETGSTNDDARALAIGGAPQGTAVLASRQLAGRGRLGRTWESPVGGVYISALLRPAVPPAEVASLALAVSLGVVRGIETLGASPALKWPNDVLLGDGKLAGVLLEMAAEADMVERVIAGVGINVRRPEDERGTPGAAYLEDEIGAARLATVASAVLDGIADTYRIWTHGGFESLLAEYEARFALTGCSVKVSDLTGAIRAQGQVAGVDADGRLLVVGDDGVTVPVSAGEVTLRA